MSQEGEYEKSSGTVLMPVSIFLASIYISRAAHQKKTAHDAHDHSQLRTILLNPKNLFFPNRHDIEMISQPPQDHDDRPSDGSNPKDDILWVMPSTSTDPTIWKRFLMLIILRDPVNYNNRCRND